MIETGKGYIDDLQAALSRIVQLQEVAKKAGDVIKLNCVNDKLLQIKELLNIAEGALTNITEAIARNDEDERYHQFSRLTIAHQKGEQVKQEARTASARTWSTLATPRSTPRSTPTFQEPTRWTRLAPSRSWSSVPRSPAPTSKLPASRWSVNGATENRERELVGKVSWRIGLAGCC